MLPAYNHNLRYDGRLFHVQTEDLGAPHQTLVTHIFVNGMVVAERCQSYADLPSDISLVHRMQGQHKACMKALVAGAFDRVLRDVPKDEAFVPAAAKRTVSRAKSHRPSNAAPPTIRDTDAPKFEKERARRWAAMRADQLKKKIAQTPEHATVTEMSWADLIPEGEEPKWQEDWTVYEVDVEELVQPVKKKGFEHLKKPAPATDVIRVPRRGKPITWPEFTRRPVTPASVEAKDPSSQRPTKAQVDKPKPSWFERLVLALTGWFRTSP